MTRVVLDTNTLVSALLFGGTPEAVLQLAQPPGEIIRVLVSPFILGEIRRIFEKRSRLTRKEIDQVMEDLSELAERINPTSTVSAFANPNPDNQILACALDGRATFLVTGDHELLKLRRFEGVSIVTAREFLATLGGL